MSEFENLLKRLDQLINEISSVRDRLIALVQETKTVNALQNYPPAPPVQEAQNVDVLRMLRTCGMQTFVEYFEMAENIPDNPGFVVQQIQVNNPSYALSLSDTKAKALCRIIRTGHATEALKLVANSQNTPFSVKNRARELLERR